MIMYRVMCSSYSVNSSCVNVFISIIIYLLHLYYHVYNVFRMWLDAEVEVTGEVVDRTGEVMGTGSGQVQDQEQEQGHRHGPGWGEGRTRIEWDGGKGRGDG